MAAPQPLPATTTGPRHRRALLAGCLAAALLAVLVLPGPASADYRFGEPGEGAGQLNFSQGLAVSAAPEGDVYVADQSNQRVDQFHPGGAFVRAFGWDVDAEAPAEELQSCTTATGCRHGSEGSGVGQFSFPDAVAVDNSCAEQEPPRAGAECEAFDPAYGDVYVADNINFRVERFSPTGEFQLMIGGGVDQGPHHPGNLCTAAYIAEGDACGAGSPGAGHGSFESPHADMTWVRNGSNSIAVGPDGTLYVGDYRRVQEFGPDGAYQGELTLPQAQFVNALAVDPAGRVYANSTGTDEVQGFHRPSSGSFTLTFEGETTQPILFDAPANECPQAEPGCTTIEKALEALAAIGPDGIGKVEGGGQISVRFAGPLADTNVPLLASSAGAVEVQAEGSAGQLVRFGPSGEVAQTYDSGGEPTHIAVDPQGNLYLVDVSGGEYSLQAYKSDGSLFAEFTSDEIEPEKGRAEFVNPGGIALDPAAGTLYASTFTEEPEPRGRDFHIAAVEVPQAGPPLVKEESASRIEPTTATLDAVVNPEGFPTGYSFQYISAKQCAENEAGGHECFQGAEEKPLPPGQLEEVIRDDHVSVSLSGLQPGTAYRFRAVAESECEEANPGHVCLSEGAAESFETLPPISVRDFTTDVVAPEEAVLKAELNPNNSIGATHWTICLGEDTGYGAGCVEGELPPGGSEFEEVEASFSGLRPNTGYHYKLEASDSYGGFGPVDQTFTTEETIAEQDAREGCANRLLREENNSLALPDCRAYEQVSPTYKAGAQMNAAVADLAPSGERALIQSTGLFAGADTNTYSPTYLSHRTPAGWLTQPLVAHAAGPGWEPGIPNALSPELDRWLFPIAPALNADEIRTGNIETGALYMGAADGTYLKASPTISLMERVSRVSIGSYTEPLAASDDLSRIYIRTEYRLLPEDPRPNDDDAGQPVPTRIYEVSGAGGTSPALHLVTEVPPALPALNGARSLGCEVDNVSGNEPTIGNPNRLVSTDGSVLFFGEPIEEHEGAECGEGKPNPFGLFARTAPSPSGPATTVQLNSPPPSQCSSPSPCATAPTRTPRFDGASADGRLAWFVTSQPLIDADTDSTPDLYLAKLDGNGELEELVLASAGEATASHPAPGSGAGVQGVAEVSPEGTHVAFVANGVLTESANSVGASAVPGADNLYVYDASSGETKFVAVLCSGAGLSGSAEDASCPTEIPGQHQGQGYDVELWRDARGNLPEAHFTPDGRYLLFTSLGRLGGEDTDRTFDIYRYDFASASLLRISQGHRGNDADGNDDRYPALLEEHESGLKSGPTDGPYVSSGDLGRSISADGSTVVFTTPAPLVSRDTDTGEHPSCADNTGTGCDVYEWTENGHGACHEAGGCVSLISGGTDPHNSMRPVISSSGRDVSFFTPAGLVPADTDGVGDIYDAREGGGFPPPPPPPPCTPAAPAAGAEACHGEGTKPTLQPKYTSAETRHGSEGEAAHPCAKGRHKVKKHGQVRCVPNHHHHHHRKHKRSGGRAQRRAGSDLGGRK